MSVPQDWSRYDDRDGSIAARREHAKLRQGVKDLQAELIAVRGWSREVSVDKVLEALGELLG